MEDERRCKKMFTSGNIRTAPGNCGWQLCGKLATNREVTLVSISPVACKLALRPVLSPRPGWRSLAWNISFYSFQL
ncbi:hypothetical protein RRG08_021875 [Elysia crispata]|uniref:Uncharacterized protein n=1 Tax=Elysia crispata TaxID=231223 RepID=A0AAE0ZI88_9GAST|nr:hypothetical protein RRG08_021875 [Elysia crispata]